MTTNPDLVRFGLRLLGLVCALAAWPAAGCSVPVFRYAIERWEPSVYEAVVFHRGPLEAPRKALVDRLRGHAFSNQPPANLNVATVDLAARVTPDLLELWKPYQNQPTPFLVVRFPARAPAQGVVFSGPLDEASVGRLLESPVRKRLARDLIKGDDIP